jgi:hypothetical protein
VSGGLYWLTLPAPAAAAVVYGAGALRNSTIPAQIFSVEPSMQRRSDVAEISVGEDRTSAVAKADRTGSAAFIL